MALRKWKIQENKVSLDKMAIQEKIELMKKLDIYKSKREPQVNKEYCISLEGLPEIQFNDKKN